ncbi:MAG: hypothetical protein K9N48_04975 [Verrucomicrobia bacterium]|nr:hypothetical protein [Verrucomicrobiota bacterium]MCF7708919.1 hypothetical protein [Verrucomicrobiota bacterium]
MRVLLYLFFSAVLCAPLFSVVADSAENNRAQPPERTCFQTANAYADDINIRSDVAIVYGIDEDLPARIKTWRDRGYRIHVMTGVSWGNYQDYLYGRFDGVNHEDEAQTERDGDKISHGGDVYYMCPGTNFGKFLCVGVRRALDAGAKAVHLEEPEFWVRGGYSDGFKREWKAYYDEPWQPPHTSPDAQWRASRLKYYLYRRALQQVFDYIQDYNREHQTYIRCYVPTHSLLNYAHWRIVSPESSLARLDGCDGYIAQVWTGTSRTPNLYQGKLRERTFETAFLEYGAMQNLVRSTGRRVWYLNDPIEDNPNHDWEDYRTNWESTLVASLFQPEVWHYEVMPWPSRIFRGRYPSPDDPDKRVPIPSAYATEIQTVINTLNDMRQTPVTWDCGTDGIGVMISDSLMFERGDPAPSDAHMSHIYGLALPLLKRGIPVTPVQLENLTIPGYLEDIKLIVMTYNGMKPLTPEVHRPLADWVRSGGVLVFWDDDSDPYNRVREWWNRGEYDYTTPRQHLFKQLGVAQDPEPGLHRIGQGALAYYAQDPAELAREEDGDQRLVDVMKKAVEPINLDWKETNYLLLRRGRYVVAAGLSESVADTARKLNGQWINLFDPELRLRQEIVLTPGSRYFLLDLNATDPGRPQVLAAACRSGVVKAGDDSLTFEVEGIAQTEAVVLLRLPKPPEEVRLAGERLEPTKYDADTGLLWLRFPNKAVPRRVELHF